MLIVIIVYIVTEQQSLSSLRLGHAAYSNFVIYLNHSICDSLLYKSRQPDESRVMRLKGLEKKFNSIIIILYKREGNSSSLLAAAVIRCHRYYQYNYSS